MGIQERKKREREMRRRQIQDAAKELFITKGFGSTTMEDIAQRAELSAATIYLYFKNKDELYASLNLIAFQYLYNKIKKIHDNNRLSVFEKLSKFKDAMYSTYQYDPLILRNIFHVQLEDTLLNIGHDMLNQLNDLPHKVMTMIGEVFEEGITQKIIQKGHRIAYADTIWAIFSGLVLWEESKKRFDPKKNFLKPTMDMAFDVFIRGIKKSRNKK